MHVPNDIGIDYDMIIDEIYLLKYTLLIIYNLTDLKNSNIIIINGYYLNTKICKFLRWSIYYFY